MVRDPRNKDTLIVELPGAESGTPVRARYEDGNLRDSKNRPIPHFGPIAARWA